MKLKLLMMIALGALLISCEDLFENALDEALYGNQQAHCVVMEKSAIKNLSGSMATMEVKIKNKGQLDAIDVVVYATLKNGDAVVEQQKAFIDYLSSKKTKTVTVTFYKVIYGSEYDAVDIKLWYDEVEREDFD